LGEESFNEKQKKARSSSSSDEGENGKHFLYYVVPTHN
jgi:hypothetical protein